MGETKPMTSAEAADRMKQLNRYGGVPTETTIWALASISILHAQLARACDGCLHEKALRVCVTAVCRKCSRLKRHDLYQRR